MKEVKIKFPYSNMRPWQLGAADEFKLVMRSFGISVYPSPNKGSHGAEFWVPEDECVRFENEFLTEHLTGWHRKFFFSKLGFPGNYYVSYKLI